MHDPPVAMPCHAVVYLFHPVFVVQWIEFRFAKAKIVSSSLTENALKTAVRMPP